MFVGPAMIAPMIILAGYGMGQTYAEIPVLIKILLNFSFIRFAVTGMVSSMFKDRGNLHCPDDEDICPLRNADYFLKILSMDYSNFWIDICVLVFYMLLFRAIALYLIKQRLCHGKTFRAIQVVTGIIKNHFNIAR